MDPITRSCTRKLNIEKLSVFPNTNQFSEIEIQQQRIKFHQCVGGWGGGWGSVYL